MVTVGKYPLVLRPVQLKRSEVQKGHEFYHYEVGGQMYAGVFVGGESVG